MTARTDDMQTLLFRMIAHPHHSFINKCLYIIYSHSNIHTVWQCRIYIEAKQAVLRGPQTQGAPNLYKKKITDAK